MWHLRKIPSESIPSIQLHVTILPHWHIWSRPAGPGRAQHTPAWPYTRPHRWPGCRSSPWSSWSTGRRPWSAAAWSSGPAAAGSVAAGQSVQTPQSWYIQASSQGFVSHWLPSDSNSTARYPSQRERHGEGGRERGRVGGREGGVRVFESFWNRNRFCLVTDTVINHQEGLSLLALIGGIKRHF